MKAKNLKQHLPKDNQKYMEVEDQWGDTKYIVEGVEYKTRADAKKAIDELLAKEFTSRYKEKK